MIINHTKCLFRTLGNSRLGHGKRCNILNSLLPISKDVARFKSSMVGKKIAMDERENNSSQDIDDFPISEETKKQLAKHNINTLFSVQAATFQLVMQGRDLLVRSKTGSGKTLGFALPIVERLLTTEKLKRGRRPSALVLAPTRELAKQVQNEFEWLAPSLSSTCLYGGMPISSQVRELRRGVNIVIGTPGRVIDHLSQGTLDLSCVEYAVLDEADRMLQIGFQEDVEEIFSYLPDERQNLCWSATLPPWVNKITQTYMESPEFIDLVGDHSSRMPATIKHTAVIAGKSNRKSVLGAVLAVYSHGGRALVFTQTKKEVDDLAASRFLSMSGARPLHGDLSQDLRENTLDAFRNSQVKVLVATDVAARGLDIPEVDLVVHYRLPDDEESFIHRCGRTGRAGRDGRNVVICSTSELSMIKRLEKEHLFECTKRSAPAAEDVGHIMAKQMKERLVDVPSKMQHIFKQQASELLSQSTDGGVGALSAAMAIISGMENNSAQVFSAMNGQSGFRSLQLEGIGKVFQKRGHVYGFLRDVDEDMADSVRSVQAVDGKGYIDLPAKLADKLLDHVRHHGLRALKQKRWSDMMVEPLTVLPNKLVTELIQSARTRSRDGRPFDFSNKSRSRSFRQDSSSRRRYPSRERPSFHNYSGHQQGKRRGRSTRSFRNYEPDSVL